MFSEMIFVIPFRVKRKKKNGRETEKWKWESEKRKEKNGKAKRANGKDKRNVNKEIYRTTEKRKTEN